MFAVEVQDAQGRVVPITDNEVSFRSIGSRKADRRRATAIRRIMSPDKGTSRKAFCGYCMALVQSDEDGGKHHRGGDVAGTHSASGNDCSEGGGAASAGRDLEARSADGSGHHRLVEANRGIGGATGLPAAVVGNGTMLFTLRQDGSNADGQHGRREAADSSAGATQASRLQTVKWMARTSISKPETTRIRERWRETRSSCSARWGLASHRRGPRSRLGRARRLDRRRMDLIRREIRTSRVPSSIPVVLHRVER